MNLSQWMSLGMGAKCERDIFLSLFLEQGGNALQIRDSLRGSASSEATLKLGGLLRQRVFIDKIKNKFLHETLGGLSCITSRLV